MVQILQGAGTLQVAAVARDLQVAATGVTGNIVDAAKRADNAAVGTAEEVVLPGAVECGPGIVGVEPLPAEMLRGFGILVVQMEEKEFEIEAIGVSGVVGFVVVKVVEQEAQLVVPVEQGVDRVVGRAVVVEVTRVVENLNLQSLNFLAAADLPQKFLAVQGAAVPLSPVAYPAEFAHWSVPERSVTTCLINRN